MKHKLHKVIVFAGCFCCGGLSTGFAYPFVIGDIAFNVDNAETAHQMVNILLQHYNNQQENLNAIAGAYATAFTGILNEQGGATVLEWQLFGCQGRIRSYVKSGVRNRRDEWHNWEELSNAFTVGFREAFVAVRPILDEYLRALAAERRQAQQHQGAAVLLDQEEDVDEHQRGLVPQQVWVGDRERR
jgi:hypothetical protein